MYYQEYITCTCMCGTIINYITSIINFVDSQPTAKRPRTAICVCSKCYGAERDYRTVERHMKEAYSAQAMSIPETVDPSCSHDQIEDDFCSSVHQQTGPTSTAPTIK